MKIVINPESNTWESLLARPTFEAQNIEAVVAQVFMEVKNTGDEALKKFSKQFDGANISAFKVSQEQIDASEHQINKALQDAIGLAKTNIETFHAAQKTKPIHIETVEGVECWQQKKAIDHVGLYIPGGTAPLFSTVLMLAIPAQIAGCKSIGLCTPPDKDGRIRPEILYAAKLCGITTVYAVGGIQAIAGFTFGTATIQKVNKIFGPGNQYVTAAKQFATKHGVAIDMPAGPSELLVYADDTAHAGFVASDLLSQAEHGPDSQVILVSTSLKMLEAVKTEIANQVENLARKDIAKQALANSKFIGVESETIALDLINTYAPEHLIICSANEDFFIQGISNAGSVFIGNYTPESAGDYASGTNHTLPTNGYAKAYSGVNLDSFLKSITFQKISKIGIQTIGPSVELMAEAEGLQAHKNAVSLRLKEINTKK